MGRRPKTRARARRPRGNPRHREGERRGTCALYDECLNFRLLAVRLLRARPAACAIAHRQQPTDGQEDALKIKITQNVPVDPAHGLTRR
jgi:hypothetical protein